jgi:hypothetical protein
VGVAEGVDVSVGSGRGVSVGVGEGGSVSVGVGRGSGVSVGGGVSVNASGGLPFGTAIECAITASVERKEGAVMLSSAAMERNTAKANSAIAPKALRLSSAAKLTIPRR